MANLTKGRTNPCKDNVGGIKYIYLFKYVPYDYTQIVGQRGVAVTGFPTTTIYKYEVENATFNETIINDENGIYYDQALNFTLTQQSVKSTILLDQIRKIDVRFIVQYNNGKYRIGGLWKGAKITSLEILSGGAKTDLSGYRVTITGQERFQAAFLDGLSIFDIAESILLEDLTELLLEDSTPILLE